MEQKRQKSKAVKVLMTYNGCDIPYGDVLRGSGVSLAAARWMVQNVIYQDTTFFADTNCRVSEVQ